MAPDLAAYRQSVRELSDRLVEAQRPIREGWVHLGTTLNGAAQPYCTKDITYNKGFILTYNYIQLAIKRGLLDRIPLLFCGKTTLEDIRTLAQLVDEGLVEPPRFLPPQLADLSALSAWMCYSNFLNRLSLERIEADYAGIL